MNEKCKYCNYVSKCSQFCEYNSVICKLHRSFPKIVSQSYEELLQENQELKKQLEEANEKIILLQASEPMLNYKKTLEENQQKEFIEYLEKEIKYLKIVPLGCKTGYLDGKEHAYIEILSKYKEIIGGNNGI